MAHIANGVTVVSADWNGQDDRLTALEAVIDVPFVLGGNFPVGSSSIALGAGLTQDFTFASVVVPAGATKMTGYAIFSVSTNSGVPTAYTFTVFYQGGTVQSAPGVNVPAVDRRTYTVPVANSAGTDGFPVTAGTRTIILRITNTAPTGASNINFVALIGRFTS